MSFVDNYLNRVQQAVEQLSRADVQAVVDALYAAWQAHKTVFIIGNGGSAATASHMMNDLNKLTFATGKHRFRALALTDNMPLVTAWGNDAAYADVFAEPMRNLMQAGDLLVAISTSGNSPNVVRAVEVAKAEFGAQVIGWVGDKGGKLAELSDVLVRIPDGHIGVQEDGHLILNHCIANALAAAIRAA
jgi:D-sedoheptulose 7-phosphate isomerase